MLLFINIIELFMLFNSYSATALTLAMSRLGKKPKRITMLSIGTGTVRCLLNNYCLHLGVGLDVDVDVDVGVGVGE